MFYYCNKLYHRLELNTFVFWWFSNNIYLPIMEFITLRFHIQVHNIIITNLFAQLFFKLDAIWNSSYSYYNNNILIYYGIMLFLSILYILCTSCVLFIAIHNNILIILYINKNIIFNLIYFFFIWLTLRVFQWLHLHNSILIVY